MSTFADLGIPFPLFDAETEDASEYQGVSQCSLCQTQGVHCFELGIGADLIVPCKGCGTLNPLDADDRKSAACRSCHTKVTFPELRDRGEILACYECLRSGKAAITKDTQLGMVRWIDAEDGLTHGVPGLNRSDFEMVPRENDWVRARVLREMLLELVRTPKYFSIQGEQWQFCCRQLMIFIGVWSREKFSEMAPEGDGRAYFEQIVQSPVDGLWEDQLHDITGIYVFRCGKCERMTAHWDLA